MSASDTHARRERRGACTRRALSGTSPTCWTLIDLLLTAHHLDDQAETLLLALLRGSGVHGLAAMPFEAPLGAARLVRPLLDVTRAALAAYARKQGLIWIEDPSNSVTALDRNYLRHEVLPLLHARWPACATTLARSAGHCAEAAELTDRLADDTLPHLNGDYPGTLAIPGLTRLDRPLQKAVLRRWLRRRGFIAPDTRQLARILDEVLPARVDANPLVAWPGCEVRRYRRDLFALSPLPDPPSTRLSLSWRIGPTSRPLLLPNGLGELEWQPADANRNASATERAGAEALIVRFGQRGLTCRPSAAGQTRSLKKLFQEAGIPAWLRPYVPLVFVGNTLLAIAGVCRCHGAESLALPSGEPCWLGHGWEALGLASDLSSVSNAGPNA